LRNKDFVKNATRNAKLEKAAFALNAITAINVIDEHV